MSKETGQLSQVLDAIDDSRGLSVIFELKEYNSDDLNLTNAVGRIEHFVAEVVNDFEEERVGLNSSPLFRRCAPPSSRMT